MIAGVALMASLVLHGVLIRVLPPLPIGVAPVPNAHSSRRDSLHMREVQVPPDIPQAVADVDLASPESPRSAPGETDLQVFQSAVDPALLTEPGMHDAAMAVDQPAMNEPELPAVEHAAFTPRQEIMAIRDTLFNDDVAALPRHMITDIPRMPDAPDFVPPVEPGTVEKLAAAVTVPLHAAEPGPLPVTEKAVIETPKMITEAPKVPEEEVYEVRAEASAMLEEMPAEVTEIEPVEQLLALDLAVVRPAGDASAYFRINIRRAGPEVLPVLPKDVLLIQDCSESMTRAKLNRCKEGLHRWIDRLGENDRLNLMGFREAPYRCFDAWSPLNARTRARARWFIEDMRSMGKTDVYASFQQMLEMPSNPDRPVIAVLVSDGRPTMGLVDSSDIIEQFTRKNDGRFSVFSVGGGRKVNRFLLDLISFRNRGDSLVVKDRDEIPEALDRWAAGLSRPVLCDLEYRFSGVSGVDIYPRSLTHLYLDRPLVIYGRVQSLDERAAFQIVGRSGERQHDMVFELDWDDARQASEDIRMQWVWHRIYDLIGRHTRSRDPALLDEIYALADQYGLKVPYGDRLYLR
jgi:hypothetical protein